MLGNRPFRKILCYHGVSANPDFWLNNRHMPVRQFEKDLLFYKKNYDVLSVKEIFRRYREGLPQKRSEIALTLDDGFLNNFLYVKPLLEKYQVPASFYILSQSIENPQFVNWADLTDVILYQMNDEVINFHQHEYFKNAGWRNKAGESIFESIKRMGFQRDEALSEFAGRYNGVEKLKAIPEELWKPMSASQLTECAQSPFITIGSHTHKHYNLANIPIDLAVAELKESKTKLEEHIQKEVDEIAYPDGSYNDAVKRKSEAIGYKFQLAVNYREQDDFSDPRILNRFSVSNSTTHEGNIIRLYLNK